MTEKVQLEQVSALMQPMAVENGVQRPLFSREAALLSLELASLAYTLEMEPWRNAGWQDVSYQVENKLLTGEEANGGDGGRFSGLFSEYKQFMARFKAKSANIVSQVLGTMRQRDASDTCKAVVMARKAEDGRYLIAIGFMGTGTRMYDWIANFRIASEEGLHMGCLQLTRHFEESLDAIVFNRTAAELGLEKLTLKDILLECERPDSRFKLWLTGHSQGGAVMQIFAWRAVQRGLLRKNLIGYSFASPSVMYGESRADAGSIPLFHLMNRDDLVCRLGANAHIGHCLCYHPTEEMRAACYGPAWQQLPFRQAMALLWRIRDNEDALLFLIAMIRALSALNDDETVQAVSAILFRMLPERLTAALGGKMEHGLRFLRRYVERMYYAAAGKRRLPQGQVKALQQRIFHAMQEMGARQFVKYLLQAMGIPHRMRRKAAYGTVIPAYAYIAEQAADSLQDVLSPQHPAARRQDREALRMQRRRAYGRFGRRI